MAGWRGLWVQYLQRLKTLSILSSLSCTLVSSDRGFRMQRKGWCPLGTSVGWLASAQAQSKCMSLMWRACGGKATWKSNIKVLFLSAGCIETVLSNKLQRSPDLWVVFLSVWTSRLRTRALKRLKILYGQKETKQDSKDHASPFDSMQA